MRMILIIGLSIYFTISLNAACSQPYLPTFSDRTTSSIKVSWRDNNPTTLGYQIAYASKGKLLSQAIKSYTINSRLATMSNLQTGTSYNFWMRSICTIGDTSKWEGPFAFTTVISNPSPCEMDIDIKDNTCDNGVDDLFYIDINQPLDQEKWILQSVSLVIAHPWPADLKISLEHPNGSSIILSDRHGTVTDDFGEVGKDCSKPTIFSLDACQSITEGSPPFIGNFTSEEPLNSFAQSGFINGLWKLKICDGALNDKGILKYVSLKFAPITCPTIKDFYATKVNQSSFDVAWTKASACNVIQVHYKKKSETQFTKVSFSNCNNGTITINGLDPETEYEYFLKSDCSGGALSVPSCIKSITTLCGSAALTENFEDDNLCIASCLSPCKINGIFNNDTSDQIDWIVYDGETPSEFTGPNQGAGEGGRYAYIESNPLLCAPVSRATLTSSCLESIADSTACDFNFSYHLFGKDIGTLAIQKSTDNGISWKDVFNISGNKGDQWQSRAISLGMTKGKKFLLRVAASTANGQDGDIAIDQLTFTNAQSSTNATYYKDSDGDGYGSTLQKISSCLTSPPVGYVSQSGDCNDTDKNINPIAKEEFCNAVDENCDGTVANDLSTTGFKIDKIDKTDEACTGTKNGSISIKYSGGVSPYIVKWNNGATSTTILDLAADKYVATITDGAGCSIKSDSITIATLANINLRVESIKKATCLGKADGSIGITHTNFAASYNYVWSTGARTKTLVGASVGAYDVTVSNSDGCIETLKNIAITPIMQIQGAVVFEKKPLCSSNANGSLELSASGGTIPYYYQWEDGFVGNKRPNLKAGNFNVLILDKNLCYTEYTAKLNDPSPLNVSLSDVEQVRCYNGKTGKIKTHITGGTAPYTYAWNDGVAFTKDRNNLKKGLYTVTVYDDNGCQAKLENIEITEPSKIDYSIVALADASCFLSKDGKIKLGLTGGVGPYTYFWSGMNSKDPELNNIQPNNYVLTSLDANNCKLTTESIEIKSKNISYPISLKLVQDNTCADDKKAKIEALLSNGKKPIEFNWSNGTTQSSQDFNQSIQSLASGQYQVTTTDSEGCVSKSEKLIVKERIAVTATVIVLDNTCINGEQGKITVAPTGGTKPYQIKWSTGAMGASLPLLKNGVYTYTVSDSLGCMYKSQEIKVSSTSKMVATIITRATTLSAKSGRIEILVSGGQGQYQIKWKQPTLSGFIAENLAPGKYQYEIKDELGCLLEGEVTVDLINTTEDNDDSSFIIAPTIVTDKLTVSTDSKPIDRVHIINIMGQVVLEKFVDKYQDSFEVDCHSLPSGSFILVAKGKGVKFIKI
jgi:subtilisin-like proprotein convertase family protein